MKKILLSILSICFLAITGYSQKTDAFETQVADAGASKPARYLEGTMNNLSGPRTIYSWTIESWVYIPDTTGTGAHYLFGTSTAAYNKGFTFELNSNKLFIRLFANGNTFDAFGKTTVMPGTWNHVAATFDNTGNVIKLYLNGIEDGTATKSWNYGDINQKFFVGVQPRFKTITRQSKIDDIKIWNYEKTAAEVKKGMIGCQGPDSRLVLYYDFEGITGTTVADKAGNVNLSIKGHSTTATGVIPGVVSCAPDTAYVNHAATGDDDGSSWANAYTDIRDAFLTASPGREIWVAKGTYKRDGTNQDVVLGWSADNVKLYGGFNGTETSISQRNWANNPTILSGEIGSPTNPNDNCFSTLAGPIGTAANPITYALIDGFTVSDGRAIYTTNTYETRRYGGGFFSYDYVKKTDIRNCTFTNNFADASGGAVSIAAYAVDKTVNFENCIFDNNTGKNASAMYISSRSGNDITVTVNNCLFTNNTTSSAASGTNQTTLIYLHVQTGGNLDVDIINSTFANNNNTYTGTNDVGTILAYSQSTSGTKNVNIDNCIFYGNSSDDKLIKKHSSTAGDYTNIKVNNTISDVSSAITNYSETNVLNQNPMFTDPTNDDYTLKNGSPAIDAGSTTGLNILASDLAGQKRIANGKIDLGCYESGSTSSINNLAKDQLKVYPNPTQGKITVENNHKIIQSIKVLNLTGAAVLEFTANINTIDVSSLQQGVYILQVNYGNSVGYSQFIKN